MLKEDDLVKLIGEHQDLLFKVVTPNCLVFNEDSKCAELGVIIKPVDKNEFLMRFSLNKSEFSENGCSIQVHQSQVEKVAK